MRRDLVVMVILSLGCGGRIPTQLSQTSEVRDSDERDVSPVEGDATGSGPVLDTPDPTRSYPGIPASCRGRSLDLSSVFENEDCYVRGQDPLFPSYDVAVTIDPAPVIAIAGRATTNLVLRNNETYPVELRLRYHEGLRGPIETAIRRGGDRVDRVGAECGVTGAGFAALVRLVLEPGGEARFPVEVSTTVRVIDEACNERPGEPLPPGEYELVLDARFLVQRSVRAVLHIP